MILVQCYMVSFLVLLLAGSSYVRSSLGLGAASNLGTAKGPGVILVAPLLLSVLPPGRCPTQYHDAY